jgi:signal transduction histidine kinase
MNLITNAIDSMAERDGPRTLSLTSEARGDGRVVVSVADTGAGIASHDAEKVFRPLFSTKSGGMGMGLSVCRSIVEAHDGELWVAPNNPNGAVFHFSLVVASAARSGAAVART